MTSKPTRHCPHVSVPFTAKSQLRISHMVSDITTRHLEEYLCTEF